MDPVQLLSYMKIKQNFLKLFQNYFVVQKDKWSLDLIKINSFAVMSNAYYSATGRTYNIG